MSDLRDLPVWPVPYSHDAALAHVRDYLERVTDSSPYTAIDQEIYMTVLAWCEHADKRAIIQQVLAARLGLGGPPADKAIILSQSLHATYLGPLLAGLKAQLENPHPFLAAIAAQQHTAGQGHKDIQAEHSTKASDQFKWDTWIETCGKSQHLGDRLRSREIWGGDGGLRMISELTSGGPCQRPRRRIRDLRQVR